MGEGDLDLHIHEHEVLRFFPFLPELSQCFGKHLNYFTANTAWAAMFIK